MNENIQNAVADLITKSVDTIGKAGEFIIAETPEVLQQLITWNLVENLIFWIFGLCLLVIVCPLSCKFLIYTAKNTNNNNHWAYNDDIAIPAIVVCFFIAVLSFIFGLCEVLDLEWFKVWLAPKVWLIEYAADLMKK